MILWFFCVIFFCFVVFNNCVLFLLGIFGVKDKEIVKRCERMGKVGNIFVFNVCFVVFIVIRIFVYFYFLMNKNWGRLWFKICFSIKVFEWKWI